MREIVRILEHKRESELIYTIFFDFEPKAKPGQFFMVWIPGIGEKPFTLSYSNGITIKIAGEFTKSLGELEPGREIGIRGPLGNGYPEFKNITLIGGGVGIAELRLLALSSENPTFLLGGRTESEILYLEEFKKMGDVHVTTDDGSLGQKGVITKLLPFDSENYAICGPEMMMKACMEELPPEKSFFAIERYMKCAVGLCGQCSCSGWRVCVDGPVFKGTELLKMDDFGKRRREKSGKWLYY